MFKTILFPINQSREALETSITAIDLAREHHSHLILISVRDTGQEEINNVEPIRTLLKKLKISIKDAGVTCEVMEKEGNPPFAICDAADELNVDVIVMGTRGVNLESENKSTASRVIQLAPCPVLVVP